MSIPSGKSRVVVHYLGDGVVAFQVPELSEGASVSLWFRREADGRPIRGRLAGRGSVFRDMIRRALPTAGGITLDGYLAPVGAEAEQGPALRTVIQPDADVLCQLDRSIMERDDYSRLLFGYDQVRRRFLHDFRHRVRFLLFQVLAVLGGCLSLWGVVESLLRAFG